MTNAKGNQFTRSQKAGFGRRDFLTKVGIAGAGVAVASLPVASAQAAASPDQHSAAKLTSQRKLGTLTVSSLGLGVQNMSRKFNTLTPYRPEMVSLIRRS